MVDSDRGRHLAMTIGLHYIHTDMHTHTWTFIHGPTLHIPIISTPKTKFHLCSQRYQRYYKEKKIIHVHKREIARHTPEMKIACMPDPKKQSTWRNVLLGQREQNSAPPAVSWKGPSVMD